MTICGSSASCQTTEHPFKCRLNCLTHFWELVIRIKIRMLNGESSSIKKFYNKVKKFFYVSIILYFLYFQLASTCSYWIKEKITNFELQILKVFAQFCILSALNIYLNQNRLRNHCLILQLIIYQDVSKQIDNIR